MTLYKLLDMEARENHSIVMNCRVWRFTQNSIESSSKPMIMYQNFIHLSDVWRSFRTKPTPFQRIVGVLVWLDSSLAGSVLLSPSFQPTPTSTLPQWSSACRSAWLEGCIMEYISRSHHTLLQSINTVESIWIGLSPDRSTIRLQGPLSDGFLLIGRSFVAIWTIKATESIN